MPPILRSRQFSLPNSLPPTPPLPLKSTPTKTLTKKLSSTAAAVEPATPNSTHEPPASTRNHLPLGSDSASSSAPLRRSLRLVPKGVSFGGESSGVVSLSGKSQKRRRSTGKCGIEMDPSEFGGGTGKGSSEGLAPLGHSSRGQVISISDSDDEVKVLGLEEYRGGRDSEETNKGNKRKFGDLLRFRGGESESDYLFLGLRSGTSIEKRISGEATEDGTAFQGKGKEVLIIDSDEDGNEMGKSENANVRDAMAVSRRFTREEKGKGIMIDPDPSLNDNISIDLELKLGIGNVDLNVEPDLIYVEPDLIPDQELLDDAALNDNFNDVIEINRPNEGRTRHFKEIARENASRFARASSIEQAENDVDSDAEEEAHPEQAGQNIEDWPGPFSTAMKIIKDRLNKGNGKAQNLSVDKSGASKVIWTPRIKQADEQKSRIVPSLRDLCMRVLAKNSDAITSLECVPEVLVHKLVSMLCDSRKMTGDILDLLFQGSPSEIRLTDCSWIAEEQFTKSFEGCNTEKLMVLQLDQCGRCMPDYIVQATLASKGLPVLTSISLKGACRLSDVGLKALISSAPVLKSINLSQCSLLTALGIMTITDSLGSRLRELYLDDCQSLDVMLILPGLKKLTILEVLSLVGIPSVCDKFLKELVRSNGQNMKELVLTDCVKLTDRSLRVIGEHCSQLCALDLVKVSKLTDTGIGYLANGCQAIQTLKFCRNMFSDEAIAAFLEARGESLKELSLNNVSKVGPHTAISIARRCKDLLSLDVSWCRNLTDEALGLIADSCLSLQVLKVFGCTQITRTFLDGHSNPNLNVIGIKLTPILENLKERDLLKGPLCYSAVSPQ